MANNIFISYDLNKEPNSADYTKIINAIKELGPWAKVQKSHWFVSTDFSAEQAVRRLSNYLDSDDTIIAIDAKNNDAYWIGIDDEVSKQIQNYWSKKVSVY